MRVFLLLFLLPASLIVHAQKRISGTITDHRSAPVSNASIHLLNTDVATISDEKGSFMLPPVTDGKYTLIVAATGFANSQKEIDTKSAENISIQLTESAYQLNEVVVTAQKREESLQQVPLSITALPALQVQDFRLWSAREITGIVPNLYSNNSGDDRNVTSIRGITTTSYDPAVTTYIDGVNQFSLDTYIPQLIDVERIEVLRGPQGTLYGRNAMGGVINIVTKQPDNEISGFAEANFGSYDQQRYIAAIRAPLVKDKLFIGASFMYSSRNGYYTNDFNNSSYDKQNSITGNYYLKFIPNAKWAFTLNVKHYNNRNNGAFPLVPDQVEAFENPYHLSQNAIAKMIDNTYNASFVINQTGKNFNFTSQTGWQTNQRYYNNPLDGDFSPLDIVTVINDYGKQWNKVKVLTEEIRFSSATSSSSAFKWTAGSYFFYQDNPTKQGTHYGVDSEVYHTPDINFATINTAKAKNAGIAFFGQASYQLTKKLNIIAGLRYDYENKKLSVKSDYQKDGEPAFTLLPDTSASTNFSALSPKIGIDYQPSLQHNIFATYSRGYRTGGLTQLSQDPSQPPLYPYKPEYSNNVEAGIKNTFFNNRLRANITAFITFVTDAQVPTLILPQAITVTRNSGKLNSKGVELELAATPFKGLQLDYNFGYTDATYKSLKTSSNGETVDLSGKKQIFTPDVTSMLAIQYSHTISAKKQLQFIARGEWFYLGQQYFDLNNNIRQSPYSLLNTRIGISSKFAEVFFWGRNLGNQKYIAYAYDFGAIHLGDPETLGVTLKVKW